jgi:hypothetical protein
VYLAARPWHFVLAGLIASLLCCAAGPATAGERYFIDFRARPSSYIGHTYVLYFRVGANGRVVEKHYAGLVPEKDVLMGLIGPIRASVREYKDDSRLTPTAIYRRRVTATEYRKVDRIVRRLRRTDRPWHAMFQNCNDFGAVIAATLNLNRPPTLLPPSAWVTLLKKFNEPGS